MKNNFKISVPMAIIITLLAIIYQRGTGPTYPKKVDIGEDQSVRIKLPRSHGGETDAPIEIPKLNNNMTGTLFYKRYPTNDEWTSVDLVEDSNRLYTSLPNQPPAGKIQYYLSLNYGDKVQNIGSLKEPILIRFKGDVPTFVLAPHIFAMFLSMLLSVVALFEAIYRTRSYKIIGRITFGCLVFGGLCLGPIVQKYAFGVYWAGFPYDADLTDNKLLIGVIAWLIGVVFSIKNTKRWPTIFASIVLFGVYLIPHSMQGSEYDYEKGKVITDIE